MMKDKRINDEKKTVEAMVRLYCLAKHSINNELCDECNEVLKYAFDRLELCKFGEKKPVCGRCKVHCYKAEMRSKIINIMRYSGPRMVVHHPILAANHLANTIKIK